MKNTNLTKARRNRGLTQVQVSKQVDITEACYQRYEAGDRIPRADVAIRIALALDSTVEELFGRPCQ